MVYELNALLRTGREISSDFLLASNILKGELEYSKTKIYPKKFLMIYVAGSIHTLIDIRYSFKQ